MNTRLRFAFHVNGKRAGHLGAYGTTLTSGVVRHGTSNGQPVDAQGLAAVLWALARDRRLATDGIDLNLVSSTCHEASLRLREMKPGHIVNIAWAIGILTHADAVFLPQAGVKGLTPHVSGGFHGLHVKHCLGHQDLPASNLSKLKLFWKFHVCFWGHFFPADVRWPARWKLSTLEQENL